MEKKKIEKIIAKAVKAHTAEKPAEVGPVLMSIMAEDMTINPTTIIASIKKAFKAAGIIQAVSLSALAEARTHLKDNPFKEDNLTLYSQVATIARELNDKFTINDDETKGIASAVKLIKAQLKEQKFNIPKKVNIAEIGTLKLEYYADEDLRPSSVEGLTDYLIENHSMAPDVEDEVQFEKFCKQMKITAGTDFSYSVMIRDGLTVEDMNGPSDDIEEDEDEAEVVDHG